MSAEPAGLHFSVLGPLTVTRGTERIDLAGARARTLVATLLIAQGTMVTTDRIIDAMWGKRPPNSGTATLYSYITKVRKVLEPDRPPRAATGLLDRQGPGYVLRVRPEAVDSERFTALAERGARLLPDDPAAALESLTAALALWRGPAYADLGDTDVAAVEISRLENARLTARQDHAAARLATGAAAQAVGELEPLVREHPLTERSWELLALALYRAGRQGDALAALRTARERLAEELGVDPGPALRAMEAAVLRQDPALDRSPGKEPAAVARPVEPGEPARPRLPVPLTRLIGRDAAVDAIEGLLAAHRLVTITGPAGAGKSRTALEIARRRRDGDGPWLALLADVTDAELLPTAVGAAMGTAVTADADHLAASIGDRETLLVLDNCEHLVDEVAPLAEALLSRCPGLRLLATSREPLAVAGETTWELLPLDPDGAAVELFVERSVAVRPGLRPRHDERELISRICRELDGLPLAIELAAAQTRVLSLDRIAAGLHDRFTLLSSGPRTAPERHRSLEAAIASSVRLLTPPERELLGGLSLFEGGFDLEAAEQVAGSPAVTPRLSGLVAKSLVTVDGAATPRRYRMLETIRQYAVRDLPAGERDRWAGRHLAWAVELAETAERRLRTFDGELWLRRIRHEQANMRAALGHALATGDGDSALRVASALSWFWYRDGDVHEGIAWLSEALGRTGADHPGRARALVGRALLRYLQGDPSAGNDDIELALRQAAATGEVEVMARALPYRAYFLQLSGDPGRARIALAEGREHVRTAGLSWIEAETMMVRGQITRAAGDPLLAVEQLARAADIAEACGHDWAYCSAGWIAAKVAMDLGEADRAVQQMARMVVRLDRMQDVTSWLACAHVLAGALGMTGRAVDGAVLLGAVSAIGSRVGYSPELMDPLDGPRNVAAVRTALPPEAYDQATAMGSSLTKEDATAMARRLIVTAPGDHRRTALRRDRS
ncbi:BTAD domain-containing putative transcriptional regulator [Planomonospora sp. ID82291]|uniref:BTAD domain-containing putative transcriptional regulator n=1 Tax=Planomonospora sp. ID82291 TaxID=2738136 RepID=UPI0018C41370|nr:BTAD domain-containing putative transcriptional regulator [Planomonospora sp. ID82291]MBG0814213.1 winged helix-turn-helix domain-containing protein [Planomonospora sp. ID82291]